MDRSFFHVSKVGPVCDKISVCVEIDYVFDAAHESQVILEEFVEGPYAEATLHSRAMWGEKVV